MDAAGHGWKRGTERRISRKGAKEAKVAKEGSR